MKRALATFLAAVLLVGTVIGVSAADPIKRIQGTVTEVGEGFLLLIPDEQSTARKFILRWKARFVPPKLPLKGDYVLILFKDKPEGQVIYELDHLRPSPQAPPSKSDPPDQ